MEVCLVFLAAGLSSRFGGKPKALAKVGPSGETLTEYSVNEAVDAGFNKIIFVVSMHTKDSLRGIFGDSWRGVPVFYAVQEFDPAMRDKPWGTADALSCAGRFIDCPLVACNGDDIYGRKTFEILINHLKGSREDATIGYKLWENLPESGYGNRGMFELERDYVKGIREVLGISRENLGSMGLKRDDWSSMNIFAMNLNSLERFCKKVEKFKKEHEGDRKVECYIPDVIDMLVNEGLKMRIYGAPQKWIGVTYPEDAEKVKKILESIQEGIEF